MKSLPNKQNGDGSIRVLPKRLLLLVFGVAFFLPAGEARKDLRVMKDKKEIALKVSKEIVVKFIEVGRVSVSSFEETWNLVFKTILTSLEKEDKKKD